MGCEGGVIFLDGGLCGHKIQLSRIEVMNDLECKGKGGGTHHFLGPSCICILDSCRFWCFLVAVFSCVLANWQVEGNSFSSLVAALILCVCKAKVVKNSVQHRNIISMACRFAAVLEYS